MPFQFFSQIELVPLIISAVILIIAALLFGYGKSKSSIIVLFIGSLWLGFFIASLDPFIILWDEQFHALVAKNMVKHPFKPMLYAQPVLEYDYRNWTNNHIWLHKQPLFLWQIALSLKVFGFNALAVRIPSIIMHAIISVFLFRIGKISINERVGFFAALFFAFAYYPLELVAGRYSTDHNDIAFLFYVCASLWAWYEYQQTQKKLYLLLIGVFSGCAVLVKWLVGLLIYAIWTNTIISLPNKMWKKASSYKPLIIAFFISLCVFLPWQMYIHMQFPLEAQYETALNLKHFLIAIEKHGGDYLFHWDALKTLYGSGFAVRFIYLLGILLYLKYCINKTYRIAAISTILITYGFFTLAATKMVSFCLIASPFAFLGLSTLVDVSFYQLDLKLKQKFLYKSILSIGLIIICYFLINLTKIQNYHTNWKPNDNCNRAAELKEMALINTIIYQIGYSSYVVFNANVRVYGYIPIMFYTDHIAYDFVPSEKQIQSLKENKLPIAIVDNGQLPTYITQETSIIKIRFQ